MRTPSYTTQFERDLRLTQRRGKDIEKLKAILTALINEEHCQSASAIILWSATTKAGAHATSNLIG